MIMDIGIRQFHAFPPCFGKITGKASLSAWRCESGTLSSLKPFAMVFGKVMSAEA